MFSVEETPRGQILSVKANTGARRNEVTGTIDGLLKVSVSQPPEKGKANVALLKLLADILGLKKSQIELINGQTSNQKTFLIQGISADTLSRKIESLLREKKQG